MPTSSSASVPGAAQQRHCRGESAPPAPLPRRMPLPEHAWAPRIGEIVRVGGNVRVERDELVEREVIVVMGSAQIDGEVQREVTVVMGSLTLGPDAIVRRDVNVIGGTLNRSPTARIEGSVNNVGLVGGPWNRGNVGNVLRDTFFWRVGGLAGTWARGVALLLTLASSRSPRYVERIADRPPSIPCGPN